MTDYRKCANFINQPHVEGSLTDNPADPAAKFPCPFLYNSKQYHTNKGWTWQTFSALVGNTQASANRFFAMTDEDWDFLFKKQYWDKILGDSLASQRIANMLGDWAFNAGTLNPVKDVQDILDNIFKDHLNIDGADGPATTAAINAAPEEELYNLIIQKRKEFYENIVKHTPSQEVFLKGWLARVDNLVKWNATPGQGV